MALSGLNNENLHQVVIAKLVVGMNNHLWKHKKYRNLIATPKTQVIIKSSKKVPDIMCWDLKKLSSNDPIMIIEVCRTASIDNDTAKVSSIMEDTMSIKEAFIIDFEVNTIYKIGRNKNNTPSRRAKSSKSEVIKLDLSDFI